MNKNFIKQILLFAMALVILSPNAHARIDILPQKILIENRERNSELTILNLMDTEGIFRIELVSFKQDENGVYRELENPLDPNFNPAEIVRISPRQFTIEARGRQKVRLSLRKPPNLPEGEYRFHIKAMRFLQNEQRKLESDAVSISANIGVTIPAVVRHGKLLGEAEIKNIRIVDAANTKKNQPEMHLEIERLGTASTLGVLEIFWENNGQSEKIGRIKNMNLFTDINTRNVQIPLSKMPKGKGVFHVRYKDDFKKGHVFDEKWIQQE